MKNFVIYLTSNEKWPERGFYVNTPLLDWIDYWDVTNILEIATRFPDMKSATTKSDEIRKDGYQTTILILP